MKKLIFAVFTFITFQLSWAQNVGDFTTLRAFDKIPVTLIYSSESKVEVSGTKKNDVQIINKNGELKIRMTTLKILSGDDVKVKVYYNDLNTIEASEGAIVIGDTPIEASLLYLNAKEGAKIKINTETDQINARINSGGDITVSGSTNSQDIVITSGGKYNAKNLDSETAVVAINAGGSAILNVSDSVNAKTRAGGTIDIYGGAEVNQKTIAGGKIIVH